MDMIDKADDNKITYRCSVAFALGIIGGKWKPLILWHLRGGALRFGELRYTINNISHKMLTQQLRELESDGLVYRKVYVQVPLKVEYSLTEQGQSVLPILEKISDWGKGYYASKQGNQ